MHNVVSVRDFELSFYKFIKDNYEFAYGYNVFYGNAFFDVHNLDMWVYVNFSEINVETGYSSFSYVYISERLTEFTQFKQDVTEASDRFRELFRGVNIPMYNFDSDVIVLYGDVIVVSNYDGRNIVEKIVNNVEIDETICTLALYYNLKILKDYGQGRII
jgi:hypothetical protein